MTDDRRASLLGAKLVGICRALGVEGVVARNAIAGGATAVGPDGRGYVLVQDDAAQGLGATLAWAERHAGGRATCIVDVDRSMHAQHGVAAALARRLQGLAPGLDGRIDVVAVDGSTVAPVVAAEVDPLGPFALDPIFEPLLPAAAAAGVQLEVHADGTGSLEVLGLEVGRFVRNDAGEAVLRVGAGRHDRDTFDELFDGSPDAGALAHAADVVRGLRRPDVATGPGNLLQRARWLRGSLGAETGHAGLVPIAELAPAVDLRPLRPAGAIRADGSLVVCSTGIHLDLVPGAADLWLRVGSPDHIELVLPPGDDLPITRDLARHLAAPVSITLVNPPWAETTAT